MIKLLHMSEKRSTFATEFEHQQRLLSYTLKLQIYETAIYHIPFLSLSDGLSPKHDNKEYGKDNRRG